MSSLCLSEFFPLHSWYRRETPPIKLTVTI